GVCFCLGQPCPCSEFKLPCRWQQQFSLSMASTEKLLLGRNQPDWDGDTHHRKCQRSSHHPEAVHLHLITCPSESVPLVVFGERVNILPACGLQHVFSEFRRRCLWPGEGSTSVFLGRPPSRRSLLPSSCLLRSSSDYSSINQVLQLHEKMY